MTMTFNSFLIFATGFFARHKEDLREGQAYMVALGQCHPALFTRVTDAQMEGVDPFYFDYNIPAFLNYVERHWDNTFICKQS